jgi:hypothetical protein
MNNNNKNKTISKHHRLTLKKETIGYLTDELLKNVVGGGVDVTNSNPFSKCNTQCV